MLGNRKSQVDARTEHLLDVDLMHAVFNDLVFNANAGNHTETIQTNRFIYYTICYGGY
jgi:hypothetical protein